MAERQDWLVTDHPEALIGVVVRTKDRPFFVTRALAAVAGQSFGKWHVVLVNDGGNLAQLQAAIAPASGPILPPERLTVLDLQPGQGRSAAFNRGAEALGTEFVTCLDDDDTWHPDFMAALLAFYTQTAENVPDLGGVGAKVTALREEIVEDGAARSLKVIGEEGLPAAFARGEFFLNPLAYACYRQDIYPVQWMLRRAAVLECGGFPEHFDVMEDRAFMNAFLARWRIAMLDRKLAFHHRRVNRTSDTTRDALMNTLDNPSYDWRLYADLARPGFNRSAQGPEAAVIRSVAADLLVELNYETSAIWQKVDGEMCKLHQRLTTALSGIDQALAKLTAPECPSPAAAQFALSDPGAFVYDIWEALRNVPQAQYITPGQPFAQRLLISCTAGQAGLMAHACAESGRFMCQITDTEGWAALEIMLAGLVPAGSGLRAKLQCESAEGYLFETALVARSADGNGHSASGFEIHACDSALGCLVTRDIEADWLAQAIEPKLSIIFPRNSRNFRFICRNLVLEPLRQG
jgi:glycosyltransferase involved in cell wall biosynthesis